MSIYNKFDRTKIKLKSVNERNSKLDIQNIAIKSTRKLLNNFTTSNSAGLIEGLSEDIKTAKNKNKPVILCMGAHPIKNGCSLLINNLIKMGYITHLATNTSAIIHDFEFAKFGKSTECVRTNLEKGEFGTWKETGHFFAVSSTLASKRKICWGEEISRSIGKSKFNSYCFPFPYKHYSIAAACNEFRIPLTIHAGIGQDIIYTHPLMRNVNCTISDFEVFCNSIFNLEDGGIFINVGSAIMGPMIFEKALSMARNVKLQEEKNIKNFSVVVNDIAKSSWNWKHGEPPKNHPDYYLRWMKTFHRADSKKLTYINCDNRLFFAGLCFYLGKAS